MHVAKLSDLHPKSQTSEEMIEWSKAMNFNTSLDLWKNYRQAHPDRSLHLKEGAVYNEQDGLLARFDNNDHAERLLKAAGYKGYQLIIHI